MPCDWQKYQMDMHTDHLQVCVSDRTLLNTEIFSLKFHSMSIRTKVVIEKDNLIEKTRSEKVKNE